MAEDFIVILVVVNSRFKSLFGTNVYLIDIVIYVKNSAVPWRDEWGWCDTVDWITTPGIYRGK